LDIQAYKGVCVFAEQRDGKLLDVGLELLAAGRELADKLGEELVAVLFGNQVRSLADEVGSYGTDKVLVADSPVLAVYRNDSYSLALTELVNQHKPSILLVGGTTIGMDLAPRVAAKLGTGLTAHAVNLKLDKDGCLLAQIPSFGGSVMASISCAKHRPQMVTVPPGFLKKPEKKTVKKASVETVKIAVTEKDVRTKVLEVFRQEPKSKPIQEAETVVCGGFGVGSKEDWKMVEDLAGVLGGSIGATRPACDEGWAVQDEQMVGQSGKTIHPKLYFGIGISGMIHHLIGIKDSKVIVAINKDPKAPLASSADYVIQSDFRQVVPALISELQKIKK
jgi:electron transfer flavoprotein alpha subunit